MNNYKVEIYDDITKSFVDYTKYALNPIRHADLLDEQLDESSLTMKQVPAEIFHPLTYVKITHTNISEGIFSDTYLERIKKRSDRTSPITVDDNGKVTETLALFYVIANDNSIEVPIGSGRYDHTLYLIELTKILEGFIGDSITFTNALGNNYLDNTKEFLFSVRSLNLPNSTVGETYSSIHSSYYKNPSANTPAVFPSIVDFVESIASQIPISFFEPESTAPMTFRITNAAGNIVYEEKTEVNANAHLILTRTQNGAVIETEDLGDIQVAPAPTYTIPARQLNLADGVYTVYYSFHVDGQPLVYFDTDGLVMSYISNRYPAKKWTITDVINRCFALIEPQTSGNYPRFRLQGVSYDTDGNPLTTYAAGSQAEELERILAPEFAFTKMTLREQLKQVGGFIHAEPRISAFKTDDKGNEYFEVVFDKYGGIKQSHIKDRQLISAGFKESINEYCTSLDSSADNLVSQVDFAQGVVVEPFENGFTTLRTESITTRVEENNDTIIPTDKPIFQIKSVICKYIPGKGAGSWDITPYIFESADYNGNLSSYEGVYPYSKSYAVYYTQGSKGIKGLFFKAENPISPALNNYAITNILRVVTGDNGLTIDANSGNYYAELGFEITYLPIFKTRIRTTKQQIRTGLPRTLAYNQSANMIETRYYGANLKGVVERLGNLEKTYTYIVPFLSDIPTAGMVFDKNYYISTVTWEVLPYYIKVTLGLSKDFNRISEYIGINSEKRMWEVSERMSVERQTLIQEYVVFSDNPRTKKGKDVYFQEDAFSLTGWLFNDSSTVSGSNPISACSVRPMNKNKANVGNYVILPSVAVSFGNSALFAVNYADNYSAGQKIVNGSKDNDLKGYWGQYVPADDNMNYVAWGIVTPYTTTVIQVEDEDGQVKSQAIQTGGKLLLGRNEKPNGQKIYVSLDTVL